MDEKVYKQNDFYTILYVFIGLVAPAILTVATFILIFIIFRVAVHFVYIYICLLPLGVLFINKYTFRRPIKITVNGAIIVIHSLFKKYPCNINNFEYVSEENILFQKIYTIRIRFQDKYKEVYLNDTLYKDIQELINYIKENNQ